ncbi:MAG: TonB-dependent receptor [Deferribacteres bacterium]|nr:TonB-dependent receptor [candidate division KSB1 bacterium]MCB9509181.1 TonB-dependent receptor [Deferribacteres bacterium]
MDRTRIVLVLMLLLFPLGHIYAQGSGRISGVVRDKATGDPLPGANVFLEGTSIGTATDAEGTYKIQRVPAGSFVIIVKYIGYKDAKQNVLVSGGNIDLDIQLEYETLEGESVEITAQAEGQIAAVNLQISSETIKNVVAADRIQDIPDVNAAESVARLPGISLVRSGGEGQKVTIRGMSPKFNVMQVNGVRMRSTDRDDRSVDLNMITPNVLSGIEVTKALTADMDADAVGGTVNLKIGKAAPGFHSNLSLQDGYGSLASTYGNYRATGLVSNRFLNDKLGVQVSGYLDNVNRSSDIISASYAINEDYSAVRDNVGLRPIDLSGVVIRDLVTDRKRLGGGLIFDYQFSSGSLVFNNFISNLSEDQTEVQNSLGLAGRAFTANGAVREISNTVINNALQGEFDFSGVGMDFSISNSRSKQYRPGDLTMRIGTEQNQSGFSTPNISDPLTATPIEILRDAKVIDALRVQTINTLERDVVESAQEAVVNFEIPYNFTNFLSGKLKFGGKYVSNKRDNDETQHYNTPDRTFTGERFVAAMQDSLWPDLGLENIDQNLGIRAFLFEDPNYDVGDFLSEEGGVGFFYTPDIWKMQHFEDLANGTTFYVNGIPYNAYPMAYRESSQYDYSYKRRLSAFYALTDLKVGNFITLVPGIRYEKYDVDYTAFYTNRFGPNPEDYRTQEINVDSINVIEGKNWFPQMHLRVKPTNWFDVRLARTESIIYPDYRSISPYRYFDSYAAPTLTLGNPYLQPALSRNYDIYASVYNNHIGLLTAGYFYKEVDNLIVQTSFKTKDREKINNLFPLSSAQDTDITTWMNLDATSEVKGFELDWQTHFWYLPSPLKGMVFNINYTHITSETSYPFQTAVRQGTGPFARLVFVDSSRVGRMPDQPNDILNATLGYDIGGFSARLSFVYQDNVLGSANRTYEELDSYTDAYYRWDFTAYQKLPFKGARLFFNLNNISNSSDRRFVSVLRKLSSDNFYGRTADIGIRYQF